MRKLIPLLDERAKGTGLEPQEWATLQCFDNLVRNGIITLGNETPGDQFFVMKYKDKFAADGLRGYGQALADELNSIKDPDLKTELSEYCAQIFNESHEARKLGTRIPD